MSTWIYPFKGRNSSLSYNQNFLWCENNIYIMDNHRAALWCWLQHLKENEKYGVFHIDAHYDMSRTISDETLELIPKLENISFTDYLKIEQSTEEGDSFPIIRWDNYLTIFEMRYRDLIGDFFTATHKIGEAPPETIHWEEIEIYQLPENFRALIRSYSHSGSIVNLDLDYFFTHLPEEHNILVSERYINEIFTTIKDALDNGLIKVLTICLSPECCGGWGKSEDLCKKLCEILKVDFELPHT